jgi:hypothetical protein
MFSNGIALARFTITRNPFEDASRFFEHFSDSEKQLERKEQMTTTMASSGVSDVKDATVSPVISSDTESSYDGDDSLEKRSSEGEK